MKRLSSWVVADGEAVSTSGERNPSPTMQSGASAKVEGNEVPTGQKESHFNLR